MTDTTTPEPGPEPQSTDEQMLALHDQLQAIAATAGELFGQTITITDDRLVTFTHPLWKFRMNVCTNDVGELEVSYDGALQILPGSHEFIRVQPTGNRR